MSVSLHRPEEPPLFPGLSAEKSDQITALMEQKNFQAGQLICEEDKIGHTMFFIEKGVVEFYTLKGKDKKKRYRTLDAGKFFGEGAVLREDKARSLYAWAKTDVWVWELHRDRFEEVIKAHPEIALLMLREMAQWLTTLVPADIATQLDIDRTDSEKTVVKWVRVIGSIPFFFANVALCAVWVALNKFVFVQKPLDTPEFAILALVLAFEAILVTVLVLAKQNGDEEDANRRTQAILDNTHGTEREVKNLLASVNALKETAAMLKEKS